jgi:hypothetical protein
MGQVSDGDAKTAWFVVAGVLAAATLAFNSASLKALWFAFNPRQRVGDLLDVHGRLVYVVDVSIQGAKYKLIDRAGDDEAESDPDPGTDPRPANSFGEKEDGSFPLDEFGRYPKARGATPPCSTRCTAINVYCRHNPAAYD